MVPGGLARASPRGARLYPSASARVRRALHTVGSRPPGPRSGRGRGLPTAPARANGLVLRHRSRLRVRGAELRWHRLAGQLDRHGPRKAHPPPQDCLCRRCSLRRSSRFAIEYGKEGGGPVEWAANVLQGIDGDATDVKPVPKRGVHSLGNLERLGIVTIDEDVAKLTARGRAMRAAYKPLCEQIEARWRDLMGSSPQSAWSATSVVSAKSLRLVQTARPRLTFSMISAAVFVHL